MSEEPTRREKFTALYQVAAYRPWLAITVIVLSIVVALLESIGIGFIIPVVRVARTSGTTDPNGITRYFVEAYSVVGIPFTLPFIITGVAMVIGLRYVLSFVVNWLSVIIRTSYIEHLRCDAFFGGLDAEIPYFDREGSDEILNSIITQTQYAGETIAYLIRTIQLSLISLAYLSFALLVSPWLTILTGVIVGGIMFGVRTFVTSGYEVGERVAHANESVQQVVQAGIQGIRDVKVFNLQPEFREEFATAASEYTNSLTVQKRNQAAIDSLNNFLMAGAIFVMIFTGIKFASLSIGSLGAFLFAIFRLGSLSSALNHMTYRVESNLPHVIRTQEFINEIETQQETAGTESPATPVQHIEYENVSFTYDKSDETVLNDISFAVDREDFVAFTGPSGAGKSTIVSLLARMYPPEKGTISADGIPIDQFDINEWRSRLAVVRQNPHIFNDTLRYNLTVGDRDATREEIDCACRIARVDAFRDELPNGYETSLGDNGVQLSGGQKQRVALARALLTDADFLVLDEATSDLDSHLEDEIQRELETMERDMGVIAVAHRLSTITNADTIYVLEDGELIESGRHTDLMERSGKYADLYMTQVEETV